MAAEDPIMLGIGGGVADFPVPFILTGLNASSVAAVTVIPIAGTGLYSVVLSGAGLNAPNIDGTGRNKPTYSGDGSV